MKMCNCTYLRPFTCLLHALCRHRSVQILVKRSCGLQQLELRGGVKNGECTEKYFHYQILHHAGPLHLFKRTPAYKYGLTPFVVAFSLMS